MAKSPIFPSQPLSFAHSLWSHRALIRQLVRREVIGRYRGSMLGIVWSFFYPMLMLAVYTFVFSIVFQARWSADTGSKSEFALILFAGLLIHGLFAECVNRAPGLILANVNYVKKVVFPLEILPVVALGSALFHALVSVAVLLLFFLLTQGQLHLATLLLPMVLLPLLLLTLGIAWLLAAAGVYLRDIGQTTGIITSALLFLSPVFYPISALPEIYRPYLQLNPLTFIIAQSRTVLIWGKMPDWAGLGIYLAISLTVAWAGYYLFQKARKGFADVL